MCWGLCCNCKPILSVRGIKATRATGSTSWTVTKRHGRGKWERKRKGRDAFENRETDRPCFWKFAMARVWFSAPFLSFSSTLYSIVPYLSFLMLLCLPRYLPVCMCIRLCACVCVCVSVPVWRQSATERAAIGSGWVCAVWAGLYKGSWLQTVGELLGALPLNMQKKQISKSYHGTVWILRRVWLVSC